MNKHSVDIILKCGEKLELYWKSEETDIVPVIKEMLNIYGHIAFSDRKSDAYVVVAVSEIAAIKI